MQESSSEIAAGVRAGDVLAGKYRVDRVLGVGAMGVVVAAHHLQLDARVAIKFMLPQMLSGGEAIGRFAREARAVAKIASEHVARVLDVGTLETGAPYMVMEFLEGCDLREYVHRRGPMAVALATDFLLQACEALAEAHALGIVHRDLKPANMFLIRRPDGSDCIKVLDFGISKIARGSGSSSDMSMTKSAATMGTPLYMSPEQMESSRDVDARTDIWALGVVLFELLTGSVPFKGDTLPEVCLKITTYKPPSVRKVRPDVPTVVEAIIYKCLEKHRNKRYASVAELAAALLPVAPPHAHLSAERIARMAGGVVSSSESFSPNLAARSLGGSAATLPALGISTWSAAKQGKTALIVVVGAGIAVTALGAFLFKTRASMTHLGAVASATATPRSAALAAAPSRDEPAPTTAAILAPPAASPSGLDVPAPSASVSTETHSPQAVKTLPPHAPKAPRAPPTVGSPSSQAAGVAAAATPAPRAPSPSAEPQQSKKSSSAFDDRQ